MRELQHVLIVENDVLIRNLLGMALEEEGYSVSLAGDCTAARAVLQRSKVDMLIADVMMPGESGLHLSAFAETLGVPSLLVSGELTTKEKLKDNYAFIGKPFRLQEITEYIRRVLAKPEGDVHDSLVQIQRWRMKAEEIRTAADGFADGSARQALLNSAQTYEALANAGEAGLRRRRPETSP